MTKKADTIETEVPWVDGLTPYDESHLTLYLQVLDAHADGVSLEEIARSMLGIDPDQEPARARSAAANHLRRAQWMTTRGYQFLLGS